MAKDEIVKLPAVAKNILQDCKKCGCERYHKVLFHVSAQTAKIECEVCNSKKTYKVTKPKAGGKKKTGRKKTKSVATDASMWASLKDQIGTDKAVTYTMQTKFESNMAVDHAKFGIGFVTATTFNRMEVQFQDAHRTLVHNHQP